MVGPVGPPGIANSIPPFPFRIVGAYRMVGHNHSDVGRGNPTYGSGYRSDGDSPYCPIAFRIVGQPQPILTFLAFVSRVRGNLSWLGVIVHCP
jgi:hypothetical protein